MTSSKPNPIPGTYRRVTPCLIIDGAAKALEFYGEVFGAKVRMHFPGPAGAWPMPRSRSATRW
jgi:PhnB protein